MTIPAYVYARFSSMEQGKGTSLKRQLESARDFIKQHSDWDYPFTDPLAQQERDFTDQGKSAYAGVHREAGGALYELERKATAGHFRNGTALVVENLDRLTRQGWEEALKILTTLTTNGMSVHTVHGGKKFNAFEKPDMGQVITVIVEAEADHRASDDKSKRVRKAWDAKIEAMQNGDKKAFSKHLPAWLEIDPKTGESVANEHRAEIVREIYQRYVDGQGLPSIVRNINERGEESWARGSRKGNGWNTAYLHKLLRNRAVLGEFAPKSRKHSESAHHAVSKGIVIPDYYPQIVSTDLFNKAQATKAQRKAIGGKETSALDNRDFAMPDRIAEIENAIAERERHITHLEAQAKNLVDNLAARFSEALANRLGDLEDEIAAEREKNETLRTELSGAKGSASPEQHIARVREVRGSLQDEDEEVRYAARSKVSHALRNIIGSMQCYPDKRVYVHTDLFSIRINADGSHDVLDVVEQAKAHREQLPAQVLAQLQRVEAN